jgi:hypothetical protein
MVPSKSHHVLTRFTGTPLRRGAAPKRTPALIKDGTTNETRTSTKRTALHVTKFHTGASVTRNHGTHYMDDVAKEPWYTLHGRKNIDPTKEKLFINT